MFLVERHVKIANDTIFAHLHNFPAMFCKGGTWAEGGTRGRYATDYSWIKPVSDSLMNHECFWKCSYYNLSSVHVDVVRPTIYVAFIGPRAEVVFISFYDYLKLNARLYCCFCLV